MGTLTAHKRLKLRPDDLFFSAMAGVSLKRLMLFATLSLLDAGFDRWHIFDPYPLALVNLICFTPLVLFIIGYDWWSSGKVQRVTLWSTAFFVTVQQSRHLIGHTVAWQSLATWGQLHMPSFT